MESNELTIVIVTFKSEGKIFTCLDSIPGNLKVIIVENSNNFKFKEKIEKKYQNVTCILSGENKGYASANNIGLNRVQTKFALVLNPDAVLRKETIKNFYQSSNNLKDFWLLGPSNNQSQNYFFNKNEFLEVNDLKGFAIFFNVEKFNREFFDENFFLYFEEIDLCKMVKKKGGKIYLCKNILIDHLGASSVATNNELNLEKNRNWHWMWSTFYFHKKHKGFMVSLILIFPKLLSSFVKFIFYQMIQNKEKKDIYLCRLSGLFNSIIGKKSWYRPTLH